MLRRRSLTALSPRLLAIALLAPGAATARASEQAPRPNLVLIYTTDQRHDSLSAAGNESFETPALDRLAREGLLFERAYVTMARCCPARASVLTGRYPHVTGVTDDQPTHDLLATQRTFADLLREAGYETAFIGKWHLPNPGAGPVRGFDRWVSFEGQGEHLDPLLNVDGREVQARGSNTDLLVEHARGFIAEERDGRPFLLVLALTDCQAPHLPPARLRGALDEVELALPESFGDDPDSLPAPYRELRLDRQSSGAHAQPELYLAEVQRYFEQVLAVDQAVAGVLDALEQAGALDETALIFTSDDGYLLGEHGLVRNGAAYEPALRVPLVLRYPPLVPVDASSDALALNVDLMPTLLELAGVPVPADVEGRSLLAVARGELAGWREDYPYVAPGFLEDGGPSELVLAGGRWKYLRFRAGGIGEALFDLEEDPDERVDLAGLPEHAAHLAAARARLRELLAERGAPAGWWEAASGR